MSFEEIPYYFRILKKRFWVIALLTVTTVGTILYRQNNAEPVYRTSLQFQVTTPPQSDVTLYESYQAKRNEIPFIRESFINVLSSGSVARQVVDRFREEGRDVSRIAWDIETADIPGTDFTRVTVFANNPQLAADLANGLTEEALRQYGALRARGVTMSRQFIQTELEAVRQELQQAEEDMIALKLENQIGFLSDMIKEQQDLIRSLRLNRDIAYAKGFTQEARNYEELVTQREQELQDLVRKSALYSAMDTEVQQKRDTFNFLLAKESEAKLTENELLNLGFIQVLSPAQPPSRAVSALSLKVVALGGVATLVLGVVLVFIWEAAVSRERAVQAVQVNIIDPVTGIYNEDYFLRRLGEEMARARRQQYPLSVALLNIDNLRTLQAARSPEARDELLRKTAVFLRQYLREEDLIAYFEDGTFALMLPDMPAEVAEATTRRLQTRLAWTPIELGRSGTQVHLSSVAGVAPYDNGMARDQLMATAYQVLRRSGADGYSREFLAAEEPIRQTEQPSGN